MRVLKLLSGECQVDLVVSWCFLHAVLLNNR